MPTTLYLSAKYAEVHSRSTQTSSISLLPHHLLSTSHKLHTLSRKLSHLKLPHLAGMARERGDVAAQSAQLLGQMVGWVGRDADGEIEREATLETWTEDLVIRQAVKSMMLLDKQVVEEMKKLLNTIPVEEMNVRNVLSLLLEKHSKYYWSSRSVYCSLKGEVRGFIGGRFWSICLVQWGSRE